MPSIPVAITIRTSVVSPTATHAGWGAGALVGVSSASAKNSPKRYTSAAVLQSEHGADTQLGRAGACAFDQGVAEVYAVSVLAEGSVPTAAEITAALDSLNDAVASGTIKIVALAGIASDQADLVGALKTWADVNDRIFVVTNASGASASAIVTAAAALSSPRGFFVAHGPGAEDGFSADVAAAALGVLAAATPGETLAWDEIRVPGAGSFLPSDQVALEEARVNYVIDLENNGVLRLSNDLTLTTSAADPAQFIDVAVSRMYITDAVRRNLARYRIDNRKIPFTAKGLEHIRSQLIAVMADLVNEAVISEYAVTMPEFSRISADQIRDRKLSGVSIWCKLAGNVQEFTIDLTVEAI